MKIHKYIHSLSGCILVNCVLGSCLHEEPDSFVSTMATVHLSQSGSAELDSDSYGLASIQNPDILTLASADSSGQRILAGIQFLENKDEHNKPVVKIVEIVKALTKKADDLRAEGNEDIYGHSPIQITSASVSKKHLNIQYVIQHTTGQSSHRISLVLTEDTQIDHNGYLHVEFRHNTEGHLSGEKFRGIVSYTLNSIPEYNSSQVKGFKIKYHSGANSQAEWICKVK